MSEEYVIKSDKYRGYVKYFKEGSGVWCSCSEYEDAKKYGSYEAANKALNAAIIRNSLVETDEWFVYCRYPEKGMEIQTLPRSINTEGIKECM